MAKQRAKAGNRLVGWLVSYSLDDRGASYEIRAGRSFVTGPKASLARSYSVDDASISDPHMAVHADTSHSVLVQDIFSDNGSFITRAGSNNEEEISGPVQLAHGDWIRLGEHNRFQVCLIDGPGK